MYGGIKIGKEIVVVQLYDETTTRVSFRGNLNDFYKWQENKIKEYNSIMSGLMHPAQRQLYRDSLLSIKKIDV